MILKGCELVSTLLLVLVSGMYWGPWLALSRSFAELSPETFLAIVRQMNRNMATLMTVLTPLALVSTLPVLVLSYGSRPHTFYPVLGALLLFAFTVAITMLVEVPIVLQIVTWTVPTLPENWQQLRDRWGKFHLLRVIPSVVGVILLLFAAIR